MRVLSTAALAAAVVVIALSGPASPAAAQGGAGNDAAALRARGQYLVTSIAGCGNCHTPKGPQGELPGMALAGGFVIDEAPFRAVTPNITPDPETGIGRWTDAQIATAIREGKRPDGTLIGPPMPFEFYRHISDRDVRAIVAYLRTVPPVRNRVEKSVYRMPLPPSWGPPVANVPGPADNPVARGAYLAGPMGHCLECHTPRKPNGELDMTRVGQGGQEFGSPNGRVVSRNITPNRAEGIGGWTDAQIVRAVTQGISSDGRRLSPPMGFPYYARMTPADLADLVAYLRSLKPLP